MVYSDTNHRESEKIKLKPISARMLRDKPTFKFDEYTSDNKDHVLIQNIQEKAALRQEYFQNNIKIQVCSHL